MTVPTALLLLLQSPLTMALSVHAAPPDISMVSITPIHPPSIPKLFHEDSTPDIA